MLLTRGGQRAGTISGGCLEAEVAKKAWWLTEKGPTIQRYSSFFDDDSPAPYGLGCGGTAHVLLERGEAAHAVLNALELNLDARIPFVIITDTDKMATLLVQHAPGEKLFSSGPETAEIEILAQRAAEQKHSFYTVVQTNSDLAAELFVEYIAPTPALMIFGAGDDAKPLADFAYKLGWYVTVADGRSHLARAERFPQADCFAVIDYDQIRPLQDLAIESAAVVLLTHSYEQDRALLRALLPRNPKYLGILGPRQRTERLVGEVSRQVGMTDEECMARLHAPVGFDIGAHTPESIALSIVAEIFAVLRGRDGLSLKKSTQAREHINTKLTHV
jgi:xanthine dehydrogenase accessory factor